MNIYRSLLVLFVAVGLALLPIENHALELKNPSHVFSLWTNINVTLATIGNTLTGDEALSRRLDTMTARRFQGKKPADVLKRVTDFRSKVNLLHAKFGQEATLVHEGLKGAGVTPSDVFYNSGHVLDSLVLLVIHLDKEKVVSGFYTRHNIKGKTPDDVFGLVDLANRKMEILIQNVNQQ